MKERRKDVRQKRGFAALVASVFGEQAREEKVDPLHLAVSVVLTEAASADDDFSEDDRRHISDVLRSCFHLSHDELDRLLKVADEERKYNRDLWRFTHQINRRCSKKQKLELMREVWRIVLADGTLGRHEDHLAHRLGKLLNLDHTELIQMKLEAKEISRSSRSAER